MIYKLYQTPVSFSLPNKLGDWVKCKLGLLLTDGSGAGCHYPELASVFTGTLDADYFAAMRGTFSAARALSDDDLRAATMHATSRSSWHFSIFRASPETT
jgi:hypothetical protein